MKIQIELTESEVIVLKRILYAEYYKYDDRRAHALSHGAEYDDVGGQAVQRVIEKIENA